MKFAKAFNDRAIQPNVIIISRSNRKKENERERY